MTSLPRVCVVGLGYVGLPVAVLAAEKGFSVMGFDADSSVVSSLSQGVLHIKDARLQEQFSKVQKALTVTGDATRALIEADVVVVCVPTPVDVHRVPDLDPLTSAVKTVAAHLKKGQLVVIESTIYPGVTEHLVRPILEGTGLAAGSGFYLAHCPERIDPGNEEWPLARIPRVLGGVDPESCKRAASFYRSLLDADVYETRTVREAEAAKVVENTFRDINIAFVNELAQSFDAAGIDVVDVIRAASTKPFSFMAHYPGCGVGGHCIPVDPYYLIDAAKKSGFDHTFLVLARDINNGMPAYTVARLEEALAEQGLALKDVTVGILGLAYKGSVDDVRESPALKIRELLKDRGAAVLAFDPYLPEQSDVALVDELLDRCEAVVLATAHAQFQDIDFSPARHLSVVVDGRNVLDKASIEAAGIAYRGIGR